MDNEVKEFLRNKFKNNDPDYVKWGQDNTGAPVKWVRTSKDGDWIIYKEDDYLPVKEKLNNLFGKIFAFIFLLILIYSIVKGDLTLF